MEASGQFKNIKKGDLEKHGYTQGCPACVAHQTGAAMAGRLHTAECRERLEAALREDPQNQDQEQRRNEALARQIQKDEDAKSETAVEDSGLRQKLQTAVEDRSLRQRL